MNRSVFLWITIVILFASNMFLLYLNSETKRTAALHGDANYMYGVLDNSYKHMQVDGSEIADSTVFYIPKKKIYKDLKVPFKLKDILKGEKVIFYFPSTLCSTCVTEQFYTLNKLSKSVLENDDIIILTDFVSEATMEYLFTNNINIKIYETRGVNIGLPFETDYDLSLAVFLITNNERVKTSFIISAETLEYVNFFYKMIKNQHKPKVLSKSES